MRILGLTTDNCLNPYDFCFLGLMPLPFDMPLGVHAWPRASSITTAARLDGTVSAVARLDVTALSTKIRLDGDVTTA